MRKWWLIVLALAASSVALGQVWNKSALGSGKTKITYGASALGSGVGGGGCPPYPSTPAVWFDASQESLADNDPAQPPTNFGSNGDTFATAATSSSPTFQSPCDVGSMPSCFYFDGGDRFYDADSSLSAYKFLHDGTGATCLVVYEVPSTTAAPSIADSANSTSNNVGVSLGRNGTLNVDVSFIGNGTGGQAPFTDSEATSEDDVNVMVFSHGTARSPDVEVRWNGVQSLSADYAYTPSASDHAGRLTFGSRTNSLGPMTGYVAEAACWSSTMTTAQLEAIEAVASCKWTDSTGFPQ